MEGKLYLIPTPLGDEFAIDNFGNDFLKVLSSLQHFIVEEEKTARRFLKRLVPSIIVDNLTFFILNEHTLEKDFVEFLDAINKGFNVGLISEAGLPCIADPGAQVVKIAHQKNIHVIPLIGASSIMLALMASGLNGQNFCFNGYLPIKPQERKNKIHLIEQRSKTENETQIFIETPYRNNSLLTDILQYCHTETLLCIASNITQPNEFLKTKSIYQWKIQIPELHKCPTVFLLQRIK
jgi:16S rRNA (cytidine1402-2'-O)-methyltransferase